MEGDASVSHGAVSISLVRKGAHGLLELKPLGPAGGVTNLNNLNFKFDYFRLERHHLFVLREQSKAQTQNVPPL